MTVCVLIESFEIYVIRWETIQSYFWARRKSKKLGAKIYVDALCFRMIWKENQSTWDGSRGGSTSLRQGLHNPLRMSPVHTCSLQSVQSW
jgi:hypothetical protein